MVEEDEKEPSGCECGWDGDFSKKLAERLVLGGTGGGGGDWNEPEAPPWGKKGWCSLEGDAEWLPLLRPIAVEDGDGVPLIPETNK